MSGAATLKLFNGRSLNLLVISRLLVEHIQPRLWMGSGYLSLGEEKVPHIITVCIFLIPKAKDSSAFPADSPPQPPQQRQPNPSRVPMERPAQRLRCVRPLYPRQRLVLALRPQQPQHLMGHSHPLGHRQGQLHQNHRIHRLQCHYRDERIPLYYTNTNCTYSVAGMASRR